MKLSEHFTLAELTTTNTGIANVPDVAMIGQLRKTAAHMEIVRKQLGGYPVTINSGYRSPEVNKKVGGKATSAHCQGYAVDFNCDKFGDAGAIVAALRGRVMYDQLIYEHPAGRKAWVHISFAPAMRMQVLGYDGTGYKQI